MSETFTSPLMTQFPSDGRITITQLRHDVPLYQAGHAAAATLTSGERLTPAQRRRLTADKFAGDEAKERLTIAGIPLVKSLAKKEHQRRAAWQSSITLDDLFQDAMLGYLRGLLSYDPTGDYKSPTNYLGQWIITEMRRASETMDNDFEVSHEAAERFRRIRAIRRRLTDEFGRPPTEQEIADASTTRTSAGALMGRVANKHHAKPITVAQIEEERDYMRRVGYTSRIASTPADDDSPIEPGTVIADRAQPVLGAPTYDTAAATVDQSVAAGLATVLGLTMDTLNMPAGQQDVIARRYGLPPHTTEATARDIARALGQPSGTVTAILDAFQTEMTRKGGAFHRIVVALPPDELDDYGLAWVPLALGPYTPVSFTIPPILVTPLTKRAPRPPTNISRTGTYGQYLCDYHGRAFTARYAPRTSLPREHPCPSCGRPARLIRTATTDHDE